jgi:hypothetical protein
MVVLIGGSVPEPCVRGEGVERRANGVWLIADGKSERGSAGLAGLARSSNHINQKNQTDQMNQRDQIIQLPATRREMLDYKT